MKVLYSIDVKDENDVYVGISEEAVAGAAEGLVPGRFLVEVLPFLRHIPPWFPGAASQRLWAKWRAAAHRLKNVPFEHAKTKMVCHFRFFSCHAPVQGRILIVRSSPLRRTMEKRLGQ